LDEKTLAVQGFPAMTILDDGTYDVFIIDAEAVDERTLRLDLTITTGPSKGEVVSIRATNMGRDPLALMGTPATLTVIDGVPDVTLD
jgi:hypothetical protein